MNLIIDNNDGLGGVEYTQAVLRDTPLTIRRRRGEWAECSAGLDLVGAGLPLPLSRARVLVSDASGAVLFQGFLRQDAAPSTATATTAASETKPFFVAIEQGWLLGGLPPNVLQPATATHHSLNGSDVTVAFSPPLATAMVALTTDVSVAGEQEATAYVTELF